MKGAFGFIIAAYFVIALGQLEVIDFQKRHFNPQGFTLSSPLEPTNDWFQQRNRRRIATALKKESRQRFLCGNLNNTVGTKFSLRHARNELITLLRLFPFAPAFI